MDVKDVTEKSLEKNMLQGTLILTLTSFVVKVLSAIYRVPYQNLVGDEGFYVYQQIYPIYGIGMTLALTGLPVYLSKILAASPNEEERKWRLDGFFTVVSLLSVIAFLVLLSLATPMAKLMGDIALAPIIRLVSFFFLLVPFLSTYRGYYQGKLDMKPTAVSQLVEQGSRVIVILGAGYLYTLFDWSVYRVGGLAMSGALVGGMCGLSILWYYQKKHPIKWAFKGKQLKELSHFTKRLLIEGGTLCLFSAYLIVFQLIDAFSVKQFLGYGGMSDLSAKMTKGVYDRGQPLVQLGLVVAISMTAAFLPPLTKHYMNKEQKEYEKMVSSYIKVAQVIGAAAAIGLAAVLPYINVTLFSDNQEELTLSLFVLSIYFVSMIQTYQTIYQSQNIMRYQLFGAVAGLFTKLILTPLLTYYFKTVGASLSTLLGLIVCLGVLKWYLNKTMPQYKTPKDYHLKLGINLGVMLIALGIYRLLLEFINWETFNRGGTLLATLIGVIIGASVYLLGIVKSQMFTKEEWKMLPFSNKVIKQLKEN